jgi:DNA polymerase-1
VLALIDVGAEFWKNYFGSRSAVTGYELTLERIDWYRHVDCRTVVCCDSPKSKRKEWFHDYKSNRPPKPADALEALIAVQQRATSWGIPVVQSEGYEADDLIATLASQAWPEEVHIVGSEKDFFCLIGDTVKLVGKHGLIGANECFEKFGVLPNQMTDWLALVGDAADAIPGCPSCGPGRATDLLERFETLARIREATDEEILSVRGVGKKTLESLRAWDPSLALQLVRLLDDAPITLDTLWGAAA